MLKLIAAVQSEVPSIPLSSFEVVDRPDGQLLAISSLVNEKRYGLWSETGRSLGHDSVCAEIARANAPLIRRLLGY